MSSEGSEDDSAVDSEEEDDDNSSDEEEVVAPKLELPSRATRGRRMNKLLEEEDSADDEFWNQDFFQEEKADVDYQSESSEATSADEDFSEPEAESDEEGEEVEEKGRRKALKPPGAAGARKPPPQQRKSLAVQIRPSEAPMDQQPLGSPTSPMSPTTRAAVKQAQVEALQEAQQFKAPTLRKSTRERIEEAEKERQRAEQVRPKKAPVKQEFRPLTQEELLAEAAQTEIENTASVQALMAAEEEVRARAASRKAKYSGPMLRYHSKKQGDTSVMLIEIANMLPPKHLQPQRAPLAPARSLCIITGQPAKYRDPETGMPYASVEAFKELRAKACDSHFLQAHRTKRRRTGAGGWAHLAESLREDFPPLDAPEQAPAHVSAGGWEPGTSGAHMAPLLQQP
ncbi:g3963 [Coccomyxa viridis]|uniref:G3963 protein n=1 Tax=Coccomyxa viridis TaxID=1274662 RepID=A0ABP1FSB5_9CHLO